MGALRELKEQQAVISPIRRLESETESVDAISGKPGPRRFKRVPTHAIGVALERRRYPRARLSLPLRLMRVGETPEPLPVTLVTRNISSTGIFFLAPRELAPGTYVEFEVSLLDRPLGQGRVQMLTAAHIVRSEECDTPGWRGYAATFDDFAIEHDDVVPLRFQTA